MSRIRTVKPELFRHEALFDAELATGLQLRLAFIGLFTAADCEGRFVWRPRTLKLDVLPHDTVDFSAVLNALEKYGFIKSYVVNGEKYGVIPSFTKHQFIQTKEKERGSEIPPCPAQPTEIQENEPGIVPESYRNEPGIVPDLQEGKGREGKGREEEGSVPAPARHAPARSIPLPDDFSISPATETWAEQHGYDRLPEHLEAFKGKALAKDYRYANWQQAFRNAVRDDWAGLRKAPPAAPGGGRATGRAYDPASKRAALAEHNGGALSAWLGGVSPTAAIPALALETDHATH